MAKGRERAVMDRFKDLLGGYGTNARLARALDMTPDHVARLVTGKREVPTYLEALVELLERTPPADWPERWRREVLPTSRDLMRAARAPS